MQCFHFIANTRKATRVPVIFYAMLITSFSLLIKSSKGSTHIIKICEPLPPVDTSIAGNGIYNGVNQRYLANSQPYPAC